MLISDQGTSVFYYVISSAMIIFGAAEIMGISTLL